MEESRQKKFQGVIREPPVEGLGRHFRPPGDFENREIGKSDLQRMDIVRMGIPHENQSSEIEASVLESLDTQERVIEGSQAATGDQDDR